MFAAPRWQHRHVRHFFDVAPKKGLPPASVYTAGGRATPDVSALGEGYQVWTPGECNLLPYPQFEWMGFNGTVISTLRNVSGFGECCQACPNIEGCTFFNQIFDDGFGQQACAFFAADAVPVYMSGVTAGYHPGQPFVQSVGGTSASTPVFAGMVSLLNEARLARGKAPMGFLNPWLYRHAHAFTDITIGNNRINRDGKPMRYGWDAVHGWDPVTGLGTPKFDRLLDAALLDERIVV